MSSTKTSVSLLAILGALMAMTSIATDIYLPAMPVMEEKLGGDAELAITGFLLGFAIAQLLWGPISDRVGRKMPLFIGMVLFIIGSIGCALSANMTEVVLWRIFQAIGACVGPMLSRAMIRDMYGATKAAQTMSTLMMIMAVAPIAGPFVGGGLLAVGTWQLIFWAMAIVGVMMFAALFFLPETLPKETRAPQSFLHTFGNYGNLLKNGRYMRYTLCVTAFYVAVYAFVSGSPSVYITHFGIPEQYFALFFGINILGVTMVSALNRRLLRTYTLDVLIRRSLAVAVTAAIILAALSFTGIGGLWGVVAPMFFIFSTNGIIATCTNAAALSSVPTRMTGAAAALLGSLQYGSGVVSSALLALLSDGTPRAMSGIIAVVIVLSALSMIGAPHKPHKQNVET